ncbi:kinetochore protein Nuf2 homolog [Drosophila suzukii]|uniref:Kinetochore protein Nuf2 homolog n=1 Tax=Drosophila suzukii TaxID=28584 RepID=A0AB40DJN5_DROSZ
MEDFLGEEEEAIPRNRRIAKMKRADLIAELRHEQRRTQAMVKRRDEIKAALRQCNIQLTDTRRISEELANERNALLQTFQQEMQDNEAKETHLNLEIGVMANQRDDLKQEMQGVKDELSRIHEENSCSICLSPWDSEGPHRIVSLKCGHLFGDKLLLDQHRSPQEQ